jgi:peptidoglycan/LPS O-acetylase OafA/YrhL
MIPGLDGIRAVAFLLVFACHTDYFLFGWVGVLLFFVLSGFLITDILLRMKKKFSTRDFFIKFYGRRFLRIFPLYYFYLFLVAALLWIFISTGYRQNYMRMFYEQLPYALTYVYNFFYASSSFQPMRFLDHFWSLSVEEQFYIVWPLLIFLTPEKHLKKLCLGIILATPIIRILVTMALKAQVFPFMTSNIPLGLYPLPVTHIDAFAMGAYISRFELPKAKQQLAFLLVFVPLTGFATQYISTGSLGELTTLGYTYPIANLFKHIWGYSLLNYLFAVLIYCVAREGLFVKLLEMKPLPYLGKISYGLYVYHFGLTWLAGRIRDVIEMPAPLAKFLTAVIAFAATLVIASLSYRYIEKPILDLKDRWFSNESAHPALQYSREKNTP